MDCEGLLLHLWERAVADMPPQRGIVKAGLKFSGEQSRNLTGCLEESWEGVEMKLTSACPSLRARRRCLEVHRNVCPTDGNGSLSGSATETAGRKRKPKGGPCSQSGHVTEVAGRTLQLVRFRDGSRRAETEAAGPTDADGKNEERIKADE